MRSFFLLVLLLWLLGAPVLGQSGPPTATSTATPTPSPLTAFPTASPTPVEVAAEYASPRASLESFLLLMREGSPLKPGPWARARTHVDLTAVPTVVREERGSQLCQQLFKVMEAAQLDMEALQVTPQQSRVTVYQQPDGHALVMERQLDGRWLVSADTVNAIPEMYKTLSDKGRIQIRRIAALDFEFLGLHGEQWVGLLVLPLIGFLLGLIFTIAVTAGSRRFLGRVALSTAVTKRNAIRPLGWVMTAFVIWAGLPGLALPARLLVILVILVKVGAAIALIQAAYRFTDAVSDYAEIFTQRTATKFDDMLIPLGRRTMKVALAIIGLLLLAQNLDIEVWSLFAGFSIFGAMVALAGQDMVKNIFGSITIFTDQPFRVGDSIKVEGIDGVVQDVGFRSTRLRGPTGSRITLPNSRLITAAVDNLGIQAAHKPWSKRLRFSWDTPAEELEAFCEGVREMVRQHPYTSKEKYQVWVHDLNDYAVEVMIDIVWLAPDPNTELRERHRFITDLLRLVAELNIQLAYPTQRMAPETEGERPSTSFSRDAQQTAAQRGQAAAQGLLKDSLPTEPAPAQVGQGLVSLGPPGSAN